MRNLGLADTGEPGRFTVDLVAQRRHTDGEQFRLSDVPLLILAAAVEGRATGFQLRVSRNVEFYWDGKTGPSLAVAEALLRAHEIDFRRDSHAFALPHWGKEFLGEFFLRSLHAPVDIYLPNGRMRKKTNPGTLTVVHSRQPSLILVDRGLSFECPFAVPGVSIVAVLSKSLKGSPWPRNLIFDEELRRVLKSVVEAAAPWESL